MLPDTGGQTLMMANQLGSVVVNNQRKMAVVLDVAIQSASNIKKKEHENLEKYQELRK